MNYKNDGFRAIYNNFCCFELEGVLDQIAKEHLPNYSSANCVLTYGYIDHSSGLSIEIIACGRKSSDGIYKFFAPNLAVRSYASIVAVEKTPFVVITPNEKLQMRYKEKLEILSEYQIDESIEYSRSMIFLDDSRDHYKIDDVQVFLIKKSFQVEACWVRIESLTDHSFFGKLINEPDQDLGVHLGDIIEFIVEKNRQAKCMCFCYL